VTPKEKPSIREENEKFWHRYYDLEPFKRLRNEGRELLGQEIIIQEKRDGQNVSLWLEGENVMISSHNLEKADEKLIQGVTATPEFKKIVELLTNELDYNKKIIVYGELLSMGKTPTRIEPPRKKAHWVIFDVWDSAEKRYWDYSLVYQRAYQFKIPIVKVLGSVSAKNMQELEEIKEKYLKLCKKKKREGFVGKCYSEQIFFKEKILRALQHAWDEIVNGNPENPETIWADKSITMPIVARKPTASNNEVAWNIEIIPPMLK
jgi:hypothetical protein